MLKSAGRIDVAKNGAVSVLGATTTAVLETTADIFDDAGPSNDEEAVLELSEKVAERPLGRQEATTFIGDLYKLPTAKASALIDLCKNTAIIDEETDLGTAPSYSIRIPFVTVNMRRKRCWCWRR